ncbi:MAG: hypothetical protein WA667_13055 [Candidatus Nitrosopolaris sp.]
MLGKLGFRLAEIMEKYVLLHSRTFKKIPVPKVLNWDSYGDAEKNIVNITRNRIRFKLLTKEGKKIDQNCIYTVNDDIDVRMYMT